MEVEIQPIAIPPPLIGAVPVNIVIPPPLIQPSGPIPMPAEAKSIEHPLGSPITPNIFKISKLEVIKTS